LDEEQKSYEQFSKIKNSIFGDAYKVNHLKRSLEIRSEVSVVQNICGLKEIRIMSMKL